MALTINGKPASFCPKSCPHMHLSIAISYIYADDQIAETNTILSCSNEEICQMWAKTMAVEEDNKIIGWEIWSRWRGNHDHRIDRPRCSHCGYEHKTVYRLEDLPKNCPCCKSEMSVIPIN